MTFQSHKDFAYSTIAVGGGPVPSTSGNSLKVQSGTGTLYPIPPFMATAWPPNTSPLSTNAEIVQVNGISGDTFVVARAQENTNAQAIVAGWQIAATITTKPFTDLEASVNQKTNVTVGPIFGADFQTDGLNDEVQLLAAVNQVGQAGGGVVRLSPGSFNIYAHGDFSYSGVTIEGAGIGATTLTCMYNGSPSAENSHHGMIGFRSLDNSTPVNNCTVRNLSINLNSFSTTGIIWEAPTIAANTATNMRIENVEFYGRGVDNTGSTGCVLIKGQYNGVNGFLNNFRLKDCIFRDAVSTISSATTGYSVFFESFGISNVRITNCRFENVFGNTIQTTGGSVARLRSDWVIQGCRFYNTVGTEANNYFGQSVGDFVDGVAAGFNGIKFIDCHFESLSTSWPLQALNQSAQYYNILVYHSDGFIVDNCTFKKGNTVIAPGLSNTGTPRDPSSSESRGWIFSNNSIMNYRSFSDPDGHTAGQYSNNIFFNIDKAGMLGGYGWHTASAYTGNSIINCGRNPQQQSVSGNLALFLLQDGGNIIQDNFIYNDLPLSNPPSAPIVAVKPVSSGNLNGTYTYKITFVTPMGNETASGPTSNSVAPAHQQVNLMNIPIGPAGTARRNIYRTVAGGVDGTQQFVDIILNNTATTYTDNIADSSLGVTIPSGNSTENGLVYIFAELGAGGGTTALPNIYKNNTIIGQTPIISTFQLDSDYSHTIIGNTGILEASIINSLAHGTSKTTALASSDVVANNFTITGAPVVNDTLVAGVVMKSAQNLRAAVNGYGEISYNSVDGNLYFQDQTGIPHVISLTNGTTTSTSSTSTSSTSMSSTSSSSSTSLSSTSSSTSISSTSISSTSMSTTNSSTSTSHSTSSTSTSTTMLAFQ